MLAVCDSAAMVQQRRVSAAGAVAACNISNIAGRVCVRRCRYMSSPHLGVTVAVAIAIHNIPGAQGAAPDMPS